MIASFEYRPEELFQVVVVVGLLTIRPMDDGDKPLML